MALTLNNYTGFETEDNLEASATSGSPTFDTTTPRTGDSSLVLGGSTSDSWDLPWVEGVTDAGGSYVVGFAWEIDAVNNSVNIINIRDDSGANIMEIEFTTIGDRIDVVDATGTIVATSDGTEGITVDTSHYFELFANLNSATGAWELFVDGNSILSGTDDLTDGNAFGSSSSVLQLHGRSTTRAEFDDVYILSGATAATDRLGNGGATPFVEVSVGYQNDQGVSATPDAGLDGNAAADLGVGTWDLVAETPLDETAGNFVTYDDTADPEQGTVDLTGPSGDALIDGDSNIKAIKGIWRLSRGNGAASVFHTGLGDSGDGDSAAASGDLEADLTTSFKTFFTLRETNLPTSSQNIRQGFSRAGGARDFNCGEMWAMLLHVPSAGGVTVTPGVTALTLGVPVPTILTGASIKPSVGGIVLEGLNPTITASEATTVAIPASEILLRALSPTVRTGASVAAVLAEIDLEVFNAAIITGATVKPVVAGITFTALSPDLRTGASIKALLSAIELEVLAPKIVSGASVILDASAINIAVLDPAVIAGASILPSVSTINLQALAPVLRAGTTIKPNPAIITLTAPNATITAAIGGATISPAVVGITIATIDPEIIAVAAQAVAVRYGVYRGTSVSFKSSVREEGTKVGDKGVSDESE